METGIVEYSVTDAAISEMASLYMGLRITDIEDREQFNAVKTARLVVKGKRVEVEKRRKELKADALEWGKKVDTEAKRIFAKLEPIETHLQKEEDKVVEAERLRKEEAEQRERERVQGMVDELGKYGHMVAFHDAQAMPWSDYLELLEWTKATHAEAQRKAEEEHQTREAEAKRLADEKIENERKAKELADKEAAQQKEREALDAEKERLADEADRVEKEKAEIRKNRGKNRLNALKEIGVVYAHEDAFLIELADLSEIDYLKLFRVEAAAASKRKYDAEEAERIRIEQESKEAAEKAEADRTAAEKAEADRLARAEQMKPDREKLIVWVKSFNNKNNPNPMLESKEAQEIYRIALEHIEMILQDAYAKADAL